MKISSNSELEPSQPWTEPLRRGRNVVPVLHSVLYAEGQVNPETPSPVDEFREADATISVAIDFVPLAGLPIRADLAGHFLETSTVRDKPGFPWVHEFERRVEARWTGSTRRKWTGGGLTTLVERFDIEPFPDFSAK